MLFRVQTVSVKSGGIIRQNRVPERGNMNLFTLLTLGEI
ncbi:Uncharacterized protein dnm_076720 [Desulfonema magnum]|uniref:Uncharacterized protein n=1 Tax=Desulfonema magnum TaxID=45655 RepID=A0A975GS70_9BACT|nr:Uncharacterized protein dnm_076720 [Desulfonema magnum]